MSDKSATRLALDLRGALDAGDAEHARLILEKSRAPESQIALAGLLEVTHRGRGPLSAAHTMAGARSLYCLKLTRWVFALDLVALFLLAGAFAGAILGALDVFLALLVAAVVAIVGTRLTLARRAAEISANAAALGGMVIAYSEGVRGAHEAT